MNRRRGERGRSHRQGVIGFCWRLAALPRQPQIGPRTTEYVFLTRHAKPIGATT